MKRRKFNALIAASAISPPFLAKAESSETAGVTNSEIRVGNIVPYSGPAAAYGTIGSAFAAYFAKINDQGGINGRRIKFLTDDDGYNPTKTLAITRRMVESDKVFAMLGVLGSPTNAAIMPYLNAKKIPQVYPGTGASQFNDPARFPYTQGWQPTYKVESAMFVKDILSKDDKAKIGLIYQNDDFGQDYFDGVKIALKDAGAANRLIAAIPYETSDPTVAGAISRLRADDVNVFLNIATPKFAAQAIKEIARLGWKPRHYLPSIANYVESVIKPAGVENAEGIITSFYLKDPTDPQWKGSAEYLEWLDWMKRYYPKGDVSNNLNVYTYCIAQTFVQLLKQAGNPPTRSKLVSQLANLKMDLPMLLPGIKIHTTPQDRLPVNTERFAVWRSGAWHLRESV